MIPAGYEIVIEYIDDDEVSINTYTDWKQFRSNADLSLANMVVAHKDTITMGKSIGYLRKVGNK